MYVVHYFVCPVILLQDVKPVAFLAIVHNFACTKCKKVFSGAAGHKNYSGFDRDNWAYHSNETHRIKIAKLQNKN